ncbi:MAG: hypothetical protein BWY66_02940 [bacterium ADurb.Bin374]|nr:MAG: hypothetical protein BWY66_02940 [bacterium ADurb.Bin374]
MTTPDTYAAATMAAGPKWGATISYRKPREYRLYPLRTVARCIIIRMMPRSMWPA